MFPGGKSFFFHLSALLLLKLSRSSWSALASAEELIRLYRRVISKKACAGLDTRWEIIDVHIYTGNSSGPRTVPWPRPGETTAAEDADNSLRSTIYVVIILLP